MDAGFRENAFNYLLAMRLIPLFPFWLVNLAPAFAEVRLGTFVAATALGIVPGTFVFALVGNGLGALIAAGEEPELSIVLRPHILMPIVGLAVLALLPVTYRKLVGPVSLRAAVGDLPGQGSESGLPIWSVKMTAARGDSLPACPVQ